MVMVSGDLGQCAASVGCPHLHRYPTGAPELTIFLNLIFALAYSFLLVNLS